jgi:sorbitol-specific phosphotransferase system component IIBC
MKELLDQKSIIQELKPKKIGREEPGAKIEMRTKDELMSATYEMHDKQKEEAKPKEDVKQQEKPKPKGEYIVADNYVAKDKRKQQIIIEAEDKAEDKKKLSDNKPEQKQVLNKSMFKRRERVNEGVEIYENPKRGR